MTVPGAVVRYTTERIEMTKFREPSTLETLERILGWLEEDEKVWEKHTVLESRISDSELDSMSPVEWDATLRQPMPMWPLKWLAMCLQGLGMYALEGENWTGNSYMPAECPVSCALADSIRRNFSERLSRAYNGMFTEACHNGDLIVCFNDNEDTTISDIKVVLKDAIISEQMKD